METTTAEKKLITYKVTESLSIRVKPTFYFQGSDPSTHNVKIGSSLKGSNPLKGLSFEEEIKYLPEIINISPDDVEWRRAVRDYWNNISVKIPTDEASETADNLVKKLSFTILFKNEKLFNLYNEAKDFQEKSKVAEQGEIIEGVPDYVLFKYCLVYNRVANKASDMNKSNNIWFYLYSKNVEIKQNHINLQYKLKAGNKFSEILTDVTKIDGLLRMFNISPSLYDSIQEKHIALQSFVDTKPKEFLAFINDRNLEIKSILFEAVEKGIIHNPKNTDSYYYGSNNEIVLGHTIDDVVLKLGSEEKENKEIYNTIKAKLKII